MTTTIGFFLAATLSALLLAPSPQPKSTNASPECGDTICSADLAFTAAPYWTINTFVSNGTGNEFCETCSKCAFAIYWEFDPPEICRYGYNAPKAGPVVGSAGGAAGSVSGIDSTVLGCDGVASLLDSWGFSDTCGSGHSFHAVPLCPCE